MTRRYIGQDRWLPFWGSPDSLWCPGPLNIGHLGFVKFGCVLVICHRIPFKCYIPWVSKEMFMILGISPLGVAFCSHYFFSVEIESHPTAQAWILVESMQKEMFLNVWSPEDLDLLFPLSLFLLQGVLVLCGSLYPPRAPGWYTGHSVCPWDTRHFPWRWTCYHLSRKKTRRWLLIGRRHYKHIYVSSYAHFSITSTCAMRQVPHV